VGRAGPGFHLNLKNQLVIESKDEMHKRGVASPDDADALALTWAQPVAPPQRRRPQWEVPSPHWNA
jgi:phage terminase large subunit